MARDGSGLGLCALCAAGMEVTDPSRAMTSLLTEDDVMEATDHLFSHCIFAGNVMVCYLEIVGYIMGVSS
ncbi:hypothetical protein RHGRI_022003 [Rhododendron griersonianum]|uniref:Uncharacterized protein n=1 Tax=Rhododendron griersonianum TaxID=479676 RepID=A0AAV6JNZ5_9ERIC|nr:hypothetical protein RHGRI_022003 [Rhododendron griersonianum]